MYSTTSTGMHDPIHTVLRDGVVLSFDITS